MDARATQSDYRIVMFGQTNLNNSVLISYFHQDIGVDCHIIDPRFWRESWDIGDGPVMALLDCDSAPMDRLLELFDPLHDRDAETILVLYNAPKRHPLERLISWPLVRGLIYSGTGDQQVLNAIRRIRKGELWLPRELMAILVDRARERPKRIAGFTGVLTKREKQILRLTATGATNTEVAEALNVSQHTVKTHVYNLFKKIGASNRIQAVNWAKENMHELIADEATESP
ncbi:MAG: response regulator transcription factor [Pseudomonadota bacterium]|nr:response regulator transcription factor [Pseudomonadota bacterium]